MTDDANDEVSEDRGTESFQSAEVSPHSPRPSSPDVVLPPRAVPSSTSSKRPRDTRMGHESASQPKRARPHAPSTGSPPSTCACSNLLLSARHSLRFHSDNAARLWPEYRDHPILPERNISESSFDSSGFLLVLRDLGLDKIAQLHPFYWPTAVREFYANLRVDCSDESSPWLHRVYFRGHIVDVSPTQINTVLGWPSPPFATVYDSAIIPSRQVLATTLTAGSLKKWPAAGSLRASALSVKYYLLFKVLVHTVYPTSNTVKLSHDAAVLLFRLGAKHPVNLGRFILDRMLSHAAAPSAASALPFPGLISRLIEALPCLSPITDSKVEMEHFHYSAKFHDKVNDLPVDPPPASSANPAPPGSSAGPSNPLPTDVPPAASSADSLSELIDRLKTAYAQSDRLKSELAAVDSTIHELHTAILSVLSGASR